MFFYLYDSFVLDKKNEATLRQIESRIIELGINGRVERLTPLRNLKEIIDTGLKHQAHTFVVVGSDATWLRAMNILADQTVALGLIPLGPQPSALAGLFGMTNTIEACNILSRRITKNVPIVKANQNHFLTELTATLPAGTRLRCNDAFRLEVQQPAELHIMNLGKVIGYKTEDQSIISSPHDVLIEIRPQPPKARLWPWSQPVRMSSSHLTVRKLQLEHPDQSVMVTLDGTTALKLPLTIARKPKTLKVIVGKQRRLA